MQNTVISSNKNRGLQKKTLYRKKKRVFFVGYVKIIELHVVHKWCHMQPE